MSSLKSVDMNIERSSTRLHAPPGGASSFSIGGYGGDSVPQKTAARRQQAPTGFNHQEPPQQAPPRRQQRQQQGGGGGNFLNGFSDNNDNVQNTAPAPMRSAAPAPMRSAAPKFQAPVAQERVQQQQQQRRDNFHAHVEENVVPGLGGANRHPPGGAKPVTGSKQSTRVQQTPGGTSSLVIG